MKAITNMLPTMLCMCKCYEHNYCAKNNYLFIAWLELTRQIPGVDCYYYKPVTEKDLALANLSS